MKVEINVARFVVGATGQFFNEQRYSVALINDFLYDGRGNELLGENLMRISVASRRPNRVMVIPLMWLRKRGAA